jgi:pyruvate/2-oxoacid:ferredoxin oxidoreductase alpha subunit
MKKLIIVLISIISMYSAAAQKYTDMYINDANKVALRWLNDVNHNQYENAYQLLSKEVKMQVEKEPWIALINELMLEFGDLESRTVTQRNFQSQIEGMEDGFYVFIEYSSQYENTKEHTEYLLLKQNDKAKWEIFDYNYEFKNEKEK